MVIKMLKSMKKDIETMNNDELKIKNTISDMKHTLKGLPSMA